MDTANFNLNKRLFSPSWQEAETEVQPFTKNHGSRTYCLKNLSIEEKWDVHIKSLSGNPKCAGHIGGTEVIGENY
jgi:hypothetical protein